MVTASASQSITGAQLLRKAETLKASVVGSSIEATCQFTESFIARQELQRLYKSLLLSDLQYALEKKVELELWNNAFKVHIDGLRLDLKNKRGSEKSEFQARISGFIDAASGFYFQFLHEFCEVHNLHLPCRPRSANIALENVSHSKASGDRPKLSLCLYICQDCMVHLGDLARYKSDLRQAESFYQVASTLLPNNGQPYNQLGILSTSSGDHLQAVFFYCKSILVPNPFPAASANLHKTFSQACSRHNLGHTFTLDQKVTSSVFTKGLRRKRESSFVTFPGIEITTGDRYVVETCSFNLKNGHRGVLRAIFYRVLHQLSEAISGEDMVDQQMTSILTKSAPMTWKELVALFIQFHGSLYLMQDIGKLNLLTDGIMGSLGGIVGDVGEKDLVAFSAINIFTLHHTRPKEEIGGRNCMSEDELEAWTLALVMGMRVFRELLLQGLALEGKEAMTEMTWPKSLVGIKVYLDWLSGCPSHFLKQEIFTPYTSLMDLLWKLNDKLIARTVSHVARKESTAVPLPEDVLLHGFLPLRKVHRKLDFRVLRCGTDAEINNLRGERVVRAIDFLKSFQRPVAGSASNDTEHGGQTSALRSIAPLALPIQGEIEGDWEALTPRHVLHAFPVVKQESELRRRSKSPFAETRSLFRTDSEEQGVKTMPEAPPVMTSYSLFHSGWGLQLNKEPPVQLSSPGSPMASVSDEIFPGSTSSLTDMFPVSLNDSNTSRVTKAVSPPESYNSGLSSSVHAHWSPPSSIHQRSQQGTRTTAFTPLATGLAGTSEHSRSGHTALLSLAQAHPGVTTVPFQLGPSPPAPHPYMAPAINPLLSPPNATMYNRQPTPNFGVVGQGVQGWGSERTPSLGSGTPRQGVSAALATESIWGGGLFSNGHPASQSIWSPAAGMGTSAMSPLQQLLQEQKKHQRPK